MSSAAERLRLLEEIRDNEITEHLVYSSIARAVGGRAGEVLGRIAQDELEHARRIAQALGSPPRPRRWRVLLFGLLWRFLGLTFALKLLERGEEGAQRAYSAMAGEDAVWAQILAEEEAHERELLSMISEDFLNYLSSVVLGLNDALVELSGAIVGMTLAFMDARLVAVSALITGIAASLSMAASEYLSQRASSEERGFALRASLYTGAAYVATVSLLVLPYLLGLSPLAAMGVSLSLAFLVVLGFSSYVAVVRERPIASGFLEMAALNLAVAAFSFGVGLLARRLFGLEVGL